MAMTVNQTWSHGIGRTVNVLHLRTLGMGGLVRMYGFNHGPINPDVHSFMNGLSGSRRPVIQFLDIRENNHNNPYLKE
jgi:hypothetical protein